MFFNFLSRLIVCSNLSAIHLTVARKMSYIPKRMESVLDFFPLYSHFPDIQIKRNLETQMIRYTFYW